MPSIEDYRPQTLSEMYGNNDSLRTLVALVNKQKSGGTFPHLMFSGPAGGGKTTAAIASAHDLLGHSFNDNFREINASINRGIDVVRDDLEKWALRSPVDAPFKILLLEECDYLTPEAMAAMKRLIEKASKVTRFFLCCNTPSKVIDPIRSRCFQLDFKPLDGETIEDIIKNVVKKESLTLEPKQIESIIKRSHGDARRAINFLLGGNNDIERLEKLDQAIVDLWDSKTPKLQRVENFVSFLRVEGVSDWVEVFGGIGESAINETRAGRMDLDTCSTIAYDVSTSVFRVSMASAPIIELRGMLLKDLV